MVVQLNARLEGAAALFTELIELRWDGPAILMRGRSGAYVANGHMSPAFAMAVYEGLGRLLSAPPNIIPLGLAIAPKERRKKRKKRDKH